MSEGAMSDLGRNPGDLGKTECALALRKALASSGRVHSIRELAEAAGLKHGTVKAYFSGRRLPKAEYWQRLVEVLRGTSPPESRASPASRSPESAAVHAGQVYALLRQLVLALDFFRRGSKENRDTLRRIVRGEDVGYVTSLLRALYDEDRFEAWILFSEYRFGGKADEGTRDR